MTAVTAADLFETLRGKGPFKAFVPTDKSFAKLTAGTLDNLLKPDFPDGGHQQEMGKKAGPMRTLSKYFFSSPLKRVRCLNTVLKIPTPFEEFQAERDLMKWL